VFVAAEKLAGTLAGLISGAAAVVIAITFWYGIEAVAGHRHKPGAKEDVSMAENRDSRPHQTKLKDKIKHVLTETRVVLPGAQALLGFQFLTILTEAFDKLPASSKYVHFISLCLIALSIILLMTPAAYHRIVEKGEETEHFHRFASGILLAAMAPFALGLSGDLFVVTRKVVDSTEFAIAVAALALSLFYGLWFGLTLYWRSEHKHRGRMKAEREPRQPANA
jgi:hypothetical protein